MGRLKDSGFKPAPKKSLGENIKADFSRRVENVENITDITRIPGVPGGTREQSFGSGILQVAGQAAGGVGDIAGRAIGAGLSRITPDVIEEPVKKAIGAIIGSEAVQDVAKVYGGFKEQNPEAARNLESAINLITAIGAPKGLKAGGAGVRATTKPIGAAGRVIEESGTRKLLKDRESFAQRLVRPIESKSSRLAEVSRTTEVGRGPFRRSVVSPTETEARAAAAILDIPGVSGSRTYQQNFNLISEANRELAKKLEKDLAENDIIFPKKELLFRLNETKKELMKSPAIVGDEQKVADKLIEELQRRINASPAKASSLLKVRKDYDQWVKTQKGPKVFQEGKRENAFTLANDSIRREVNRFLEEKAVNVDVKASLQRQHSFYEALERIQPKAAKEADNAVARAFQQMMQAVGIKNKLVQQIAALVGIGGLGAAATFAPAAAILGVGGFLTYKAGKLVLRPEIRIKLGHLLQEYARVAGSGSALEVAEKINRALDERGVSVGLSIKDISKEGFQDFSDLSTKILGKLKGKTITSKQEIMDFTNASDLKQPERDLFRRLLAEEGDKVDVPAFANKVKTELLLLETQSSDVYKAGKIGVGNDSMLQEGKWTPKYESISLPKELRGKVANYKENIYESPISTSAGDVHFNYQSKNYFAHSRLEDMAKGDTRRVIELQSDLFQKGRLEQEFGSYLPNGGLVEYPKGRASMMPAEEKAIKEAKSKLEPYRNTWHERVIREEVKQAAIDGKTKLQFPTGETAMKIEGLVETQNWISKSGGNSPLRPETLKVGEWVRDRNGNSDWIITDVLGDGKFKAVLKNKLEEIYPSTKDFKITESSKAYIQRELGQSLDSLTESFDISGKVDTNNPIFRFYEKEVGRYLKNKYGATPIKDPQGVSWWELKVPKEAKKLPIEAYGVAPISYSYLGQKDKKRKNQESSRKPK